MKKDTKKAIIVANGDIKNTDTIYRRITHDYGFSHNNIIISADGGAENALSLKLIPDIVIGDMDSISLKVKKELNLKSKNITYIQTSSEKDETDSQLALEKALEIGVKKIIMVGAIGTRIDHSLANLIMLSSPFLKTIDAKIVTENEEIFAVRKSCSIEGKIGNTVSILSLTPYTFFENTEGLKYKLKNEKLLFSPIRGVSNKFTDKIARIKIKEGIILIIKQI